MEQQNLFRQNKILPLEDLLASSERQDNGAPVKLGSEFPKTIFSEETKISEQNTKMSLPPILAEEDKAEILAQSQPPVSPKASRKRQLIWGILGFTCGVIFWHFVGFWGFVEDAVLKGPSRTEYTNSIIDNPELKTKGSITKTSSRKLVPQNHVACITLVMDRFTNQTFSKPCARGKAYYQGRKPMQTAARTDLW